MNTLNIIGAILMATLFLLIGTLISISAVRGWKDLDPSSKHWIKTSATASIFFAGGGFLIWAAIFAA
ncbi:MAG: hypothetical protein ABIF88_01740 [archaeon]